ncbi:MAG: fibronectin type III domain-containing protein [bacterium]|nr:fibronectin type III domain-containing protein [bacterium]
MKKILKLSFLATLLLSVFLLSNCKKEEEIIETDPIPDPVPEQTEYNYDYFPYFENSVFQFNLSADNDKADIYGNMSFQVESFDETTHTAKVMVSKNFGKNIPLDDYFYVRKTDENTLEKSTDGSTWRLWLDCETFSTDFNFLMTGPVSKPSSLMGSIDRECESSSISTDAGSFSTLKIDAEYNNSSSDSYLYTDEGTEHFDINVGFIYSYMNYVDWSMGYPYIISTHRTATLAGYKIYLPDGSILEQGEIQDGTTIPDSPSDLTGERLSGTSIKVQWSDKSLNEDEFLIERREYQNGDYAALTSVSVNTNEYTDNDITADKRYEYRVKASNSAGSSDYSNELSINLYGVPEAPWDPSGGYNSNLNYLFLMWWARYSDNITHFQLAYQDGDDWIDYSFQTPSNPSNISNDKWLESTKLYYNGGQPFPAGTFRFRIKAVNSYGESYYSEIVEVSPYGKKNNNSNINHKLIQNNKLN